MSVWRDGLFEARQFTLEGGGVIAPLRIAYSVSQSSVSASGGVIVLLPSASGLRRWAHAHVGATATFDPDQYTIVTLDAIGGGGSSRPSASPGVQFPAVSIRDHARAIHTVLTQGLGFTQIVAAGGPSMGAMIALELGLLFPRFARSLLLYSPATRCSAIFRVLITAITRIATLPDGVYAAGLAYFPSLVSHDYLQRLSDEQVASVARTVAENWVSEWAREDLLSRYATVASHDVSGLNQSCELRLSELTSAALLMPSTSDGLLPLAAARRMAELIPDSFCSPIKSDLGHWAASQPAGTVEFEQIRSATRRFLADRVGQ